MGSKRNPYNSPKNNEESRSHKKETVKTPSLKTLIYWNITKALQSNPRMDLKVALQKAQRRLEEARDCEDLMLPDVRNLSCALLAWQQLGHRNADSLFKFLEEYEHKQNEESICTSISYGTPTVSSQYSGTKTPSRTSCQWGTPAKVDFSTSIGLVVKLPAEPQLLMHVCPANPTNDPKGCCGSKDEDIAKRINSACCMDKACMEKLQKMENESKDLRMRAGQVARRESQRTELLERAEMAWRDLDVAYQRRLRLAKQKEADFEAQSKKLLEERNRDKEACRPSAKALEQKTKMVEQEENKLKELEKEVCTKAIARAKLAEQDASGDAELIEHQLKSSQLERNLALKEEQEKRKQRALANAADAAQVLTYEAEYAQLAEIEALGKQALDASQDLLDEDMRLELLKKRLEDYMEEKNGIIEDLEKCQAKCDARMNWLVKELKTKREKMVELEMKAEECLCKDPVDKAVEVKRTTSLAAMCKCTPGELLKNCSCTSVRSRLLSTLLKDLFDGLKSEMETIGSQMPCHLLKCLEDKHNWDRTTDVKTNIRAYFSRLLLGELDIAIATVIEQCHAQWVGECCADRRQSALQAQTLDRHSAQWQEHELEMRAQKKAQEIAEKMFKEKAKELSLQAQEHLSKRGRPPCECDMSDNRSSAVYHCVIPPYPDGNLRKKKNGVNNPLDNVHRKEKTWLQMMQIKTLKKDANCTKMPVLNTLQTSGKNKKKILNNEIMLKSNGIACKPAATRRISNVPIRKCNKNITNKVYANTSGSNDANKILKGPQQYAINMCLTDNNHQLISSQSHEGFPSRSGLNNDDQSFLLSLKVIKPVIPKTNDIQECNDIILPSCVEKCNCFHKTPSNTSVDKLINILTKLKNDLVDSRHNNIKEAVNSDSLFKITHRSLVNVLQELCGKRQSQCSVPKLEEYISDQNDTTLQQNKKLSDGADTPNSRLVRMSQSKYLGIVNLNDSPCKYMANVQNVTPNTSIVLHETHPSICVDSNFQSAEADKHSFLNKVRSETKCDNCRLNTSLVKTCECVDKIPEKDNTVSSAISHLDCEKCIQCLGVTLVNVNHSLGKLVMLDNHNSKGSCHEITSNVDDYYKSELKQKSKKVNIIFNNQNNSNEIGDVPKNPALTTTNQCNNCVQLLGVTLDKANLSKHNKIKTNHSIERMQTIRPWDDKEQNAYEKSDDKRLTTSKELRKRNSSFKHIKAVHVMNVNNRYAKLLNKFDHVSKNESIQNSNNILNSEPCVCCLKSNEDSTKDLEVNAFQLLEEHLKLQLDKFKNSSCKSSCLQNTDEKNILGNTLLKVKKLILESASTVTCKCVENSQSKDGSWTRAYSLLQEYLKTKIERVKCLCDSPENIREDNLVPRVLSKIICLIEKDLQRLKNICQCKDSKLDSINKYDMHNMCTSPFAGKLSNCNSPINSTATKENYMPSSQVTESVLVTYFNSPSMSRNKSAQVLLREAVMTKSCDALETYSKYSEVQTLDMLSTEITVDSYIKTDGDYLSRYKMYKKDFIKEDKEPTNYNDDERDHRSTLFQENPITITSTLLPLDGDITDSKKNVVLGDQKNVKEVIQNKDENISEVCMPYVGCTINCCCDSDLGCVCTKSSVPANIERLKTNNIWNTFTQKQGISQNISYILNSTRDTIPKDLNSVNVIVTDATHGLEIHENDDYVFNFNKKKDVDKYYYNTELFKLRDKNMCDCVVSASDEKNILLKKSKQRFDIMYGTTDTYIDEPNDYSLPPKTNHQGIFTQNTSELQKTLSIGVDKSDTSVITDHVSHKCESSPTNCDCAMVPVCHVKMLVENIGNKLVKAECTCDSLKSVCPIHSKVL